MVLILILRLEGKSSTEAEKLKEATSHLNSRRQATLVHGSICSSIFFSRERQNLIIIKLTGSDLLYVVRRSPPDAP